MSSDCETCGEHILDCSCPIPIKIPEGYFTMDQFKAYLNDQKCNHCDKKATWLPFNGGIAFCDEHYPYKDEKE